MTVIQKKIRTALSIGTASLALANFGFEHDSSATEAVGAGLPEPPRAEVVLESALATEILPKLPRATSVGLTSHVQIAEAVRNSVDQRLELQPNSGIMVAVTDGCQQKVYGAGELSQGNLRPPDIHSIFEIGSVTKVFTVMVHRELESCRFGLSNVGVVVV